MKRGQAAVLLVVVLVAAIALFILVTQVSMTGKFVQYYNPAHPWSAPTFTNTCQGKVCTIDTDCGGECGHCSWSTHTCVGIYNPPNAPSGPSTSQRLGEAQQKPYAEAMKRYDDCRLACQDSGGACLGENSDPAAREECLQGGIACMDGCDSITWGMPHARNSPSELHGANGY